MTKHSGDEPPDPQVRSLLAHVERELLGLLKLGFGEMRVSCIVEKDQRRALTVAAGPSKRFVVPIDEVPGANERRDP